MIQMGIIRGIARHSIGRTALALFPLLGSVGCSAAASDRSDETVGAVTEAVTSDPISLCNQDPRVNIGLVPLSVCAGARVFFDEKFGGNGRTCGSCHPAANNYTLDATFIASVPATDPLFVAENPAFNLSTLETSDIHSGFALIRENVDGFEDIQHKFVSRSVPHTLSLATSITRDPADATGSLVQQRTGWGGDGAPGDGTLRSFLDGAIKQHYPKDPSRTPGVSFRFASEAEKDQVLAFQLALGRTNELDLNQVSLTDAGATIGRAAFMDPMVGRCNECHGNAGANALASGKNRNFNTGVIQAPTAFVAQPDGSFLFDGGFGGQGLTKPNLVTVTGQPDAFGDGSFSPPPLIEAADTAPFFHTNAFGSPVDNTQGIEGAVSFYATNLFLQSPAAKELDARFGAPVNVGPVIGEVGRFLRVLNASFNLAMAQQRLDAAHTLNVDFWSYRDDIQKGLLRLASEEIDDAIRVLLNASGAPLHPAQQTSLQSAQSLLAQAMATSDPAVRKARTESASALVIAAKNAFGTNMNFNLGAGNLMF